MSSTLLLASMMAAGSMQASIGSYARAIDWRQAQCHATISAEMRKAAAVGEGHIYTRKATQTPSKYFKSFKIREAATYTSIFTPLRHRNTKYNFRTLH